MNLQVCVFGQRLSIIRDLNHQLSCRSNNQRARLTGKTLSLNGVFHQVINDRQQEGRGFTGTGLRLADHIVAIESMRQRLCLNR